MPHSPQRWIPHEGPENPPPAAECAYQCEICNNAVFSTFKACADHEEECAVKHGKMLQPQDQLNEGDETKPPQPSPNTQKKEEKEQREAVEAVLRLKTGTEGSDA
jgi:hypothetical protein